jgi:site-specific DNA recombinase
LDRTRRAKRHKVETRQQFIGAIAPYGYRYIPARNAEHGELKIEPEEAAIVRDMYKWVDTEGLSARRVADRLTDKGLRPRKRGTRWARSSVLRILHGQIYIGTWYYNKHQLREPASIFPRHAGEVRRSSHRLRTTDEWIPVRLPTSLRVVSDEQWTRVQQQLDRNRCFSPRNSKHQYLLSGLVRCGGCNAPYVGNPSHGWFQYRCAKRCKRLPMVSEEVLNNTVWSALETALNNPDILEQAIQDIQRPVAPPEDGSKHVQEVLGNIRTEETRILEAYRLGILNTDQLARELAAIAARRQFFEDQKKAAHAEQLTIPLHMTVQAFCEEIRQRLSQLTFETKRAVIRLVLRQITFEGVSVRIAGIIPFKSAGSIVNTASARCGRNPAGEKHAGAEFILVSKLLRAHSRVYRPANSERLGRL